MSLGPTPDAGQRPGSVKQTEKTVPVAKMPTKAEGIPTKGITGGSAEDDKLFDIFEEVPVNPQKKKKPAEKKPSEMEMLKRELAGTQEAFFRFVKMMEGVLPELLKNLPRQSAPAQPMQRPDVQGAVPTGAMQRPAMPMPQRGMP